MMRRGIMVRPACTRMATEIRAAFSGSWKAVEGRNMPACLPASVHMGHVVYCVLCVGGWGGGEQGAGGSQRSPAFVGMEHAWALNGHHVL